MSKDFISLIAYLDVEDLAVFKRQLDAQRIIYLVNQHGPNMDDNQNAYYEIKVGLQDYARAKIIANKFKTGQFIKKQKCPKCGSLLNEPIKHLNLLQKIFFLGTKPVQCKKCKTKYGI